MALPPPVLASLLVHPLEGPGGSTSLANALGSKNRLKAQTIAMESTLLK